MLQIADLLAEFGALYKKGNANTSQLIRMLMERTEIENFFVFTPTDSTTLERATMEMSRVLQAYQSAFTPIGTLTIKPRKIPLYPLKIDATIIPRDLQASWAGFLAEKGVDPVKMPIITYWLQFLIDKAKEDYELSEVFHGIYEEPTEDVASDAGTQVQGLRAQINTSIDAGTIVPVAMGAVPSDPAEMVEYIEDMYRPQSDLLLKQIDYSFMSPANAKLFMEGMDIVYNGNYRKEDINLIKNTNIRIQGLISHAGSNKIWSTPKANRAYCSKNGSQENVFDLQKDGRNVNALTDFWKGIGFWVDEYVITNDDDLAHGVPE